MYDDGEKVYFCCHKIKYQIEIVVIKKYVCIYDVTRSKKMLFDVFIKYYFLSILHLLLLFKKIVLMLIKKYEIISIIYNIYVLP